MVGAEHIQNAYIYIYHLGLCFNLPTLPDQISDNMPISYTATPILGRSAPQQTFSGAGPRVQQVTLKFNRHLFCLENQGIVVPQKGSLDAITRYQVETGQLSGGKQQLISATAQDASDYFINCLSTLSLPKYTDSTKAIIPPSLLIRFSNESSIRGVPSNFQKIASGVWLKGGKLSDITLSFTVTETDALSAQYIAANGTLRSLSSDLTRGSLWQF